MNRALLALALGLLAASPAPATLVAGSVHDQHGLPIADADVTLTGTTEHALTQSDGTFVLHGSGAAVEIRCAYCRAQRAPVDADGTVIAVVQRYDAVRLEAPSADDLAVLPYARVESALSLTPFIVLTQSSTSAPGAFLHDASISTPGGLIVVNGIPDYNSATGISTLGTIPAQTSSNAAVTRAPAAYTYGNLGLSGIYDVATNGPGIALEGGSDVAARLAADSQSVQSTASYSNWDQGDRRQLASGQLDLTSGQSQAQLAVLAANGNDAVNGPMLASSFSALRFSIERTQGIDAYADVVADRGSDGYGPTMFTFDDNWSDVSATAGVRSHADVAPFAEFSVRDSHAWTWSPQTAPYLAGSIDQGRALSGITTSSSWYSAQAAIGFDAIGYNAVSPDKYAYTLQGRDESVNVDLHPAGGWMLDAASASGYAISPLVDSYQEEGTTPIELQNQNRIALGYGDARRLRFDALAVQTRSDTGINDVGNGADLAWQIAPQISLRTWWLNVKPVAGPSQQVGSAWATFTPGVIRLDVIWRRDLIGNAPDAHVDGDVSGPLSRNVQWFVHTEQRLRIRSTDIGVRL